MQKYLWAQNQGLCLLLSPPDFLPAWLQVFSCQYPLCMILSRLFPGVEIQPFSEVTHVSDIPRTQHVSHRLILPTLLCGCVWNNKSAVYFTRNAEDWDWKGSRWSSKQKVLLHDREPIHLFIHLLQVHFSLNLKNATFVPFQLKPMLENLVSERIWSSCTQMLWDMLWGLHEK